jgi:hypothetical protein
MHIAFYETIAGVIPVLFLALIVEERMAPPNEGFLDHFLPVVTAALLFIGEVIVRVWSIAAVPAGALPCRSQSSRALRPSCCSETLRRGASITSMTSG